MKKYIIAIIILAILYIGFTSNFVSNVISDIYIGEEYFIPDESNYFDFVVTEMNNGSGEWWVYAEDEDNYYYLITYEPQRYERVLKEDAQTCIGFNSKDITTWCEGKSL